MTVERLEAEMSSRELSEWLAFNAVEPLEDAYWIGAQNCAVAAQAAGVKATIDDYLPRVQRKAAPSRLSPKQSAGMLGRLFSRPRS